MFLHELVPMRFCKTFFRHFSSEYILLKMSKQTKVWKCFTIFYQFFKKKKFTASYFLSFFFPLFCIFFKWFLNLHNANFKFLYWKLATMHLVSRSAEQKLDTKKTTFIKRMCTTHFIRYFCKLMYFFMSVLHSRHFKKKFRLY